MNTAKNGRFTFVLHSHLPYVLSHGNWPHGMIWLSEAASETYIPLWRAFRKLADQGHKLAVTIGMSPVLVEQLRDPVFEEEFQRYLIQKKEAARGDEEEFQRLGEDRKAETARFWLAFFQQAEEDYNGPLGRDIVGGFKQLQDEGVIEIITCGATHGYLPLLSTDEAVNAQIELAVRSYRKHFDRDPKGIWLPECAYRPAYHWKSPVDDSDEGFDRKGVEEIVQEHGLRYFIVDSHLLEGGKAIGTYLARFEGLKKLWDQSRGSEEFEVEEEHEPYRGYWLEGTVGQGEPVGVLARDPKTSLQVWSGEWGYPGDGSYLDFHKKHFPGGHRYWRVTSPKADLGDKEEYDIEAVEDRLRENSDHFIGLLNDVLKSAETPVEDRWVTCPFDTELFGHWWFEGPRWLEKVLLAVSGSEEVQQSHGGELIESMEEAPVLELPEGSWGEGGFHYIWLNEQTEWTWRLIHESEKHMTRLARKHKGATGLLGDLLAQLGRELLLMESSDWQFLISTIAAADYAELRLRHHYKDFDFLRELVEKVADGEELTYDERERFEAIRQRDTLFEDLDITMWT